MSAPHDPRPAMPPPSQMTLGLTRFGVRKPVPTQLLMFSLIFAGIFCALTMRREFFPETDPDAARIILPYPGATPEEIEQGMARKVEDAIADLEEVKDITTILNEGLGAIVVKFNEGVVLREGLDKLQNAVDSLTDLPDDADRIRVVEQRPNIPAIMLTVHGDAGEEPLKRTAQGVADDLRSLPGMGTILLSGARNYEIRIDVAPTALVEHGISLPSVAAAVRAWMSDIPGGTVRTGTGNVSVRTLGVPERADRIREIVVKATADGQSLRLGEIAIVREGFVDQPVERRFNGQPAVSLTAFKTGDQDAVEIASMVRAYAAGRLGQPYPGGASDRVLRPGRVRAWELGASRPDPPAGNLTIHSDLSRLIEGRLELLTRNARQGAVLIFLVLILVLNVRTAWWVMVGLFTAICGTLLAMTGLGVTLNLLTMFGLLITLGMLTDDAIVVAENINRRHEAGEPPMTAAVAGAEQVFWPVVGTVLTTIVAFLPLAFVKGPVGELLKALPMVVFCALFISLVETMVILPSHMAHSLERRARRKPGRIERAVEAFFAWRDRRIILRAIDAYAALLRFLLGHRYLATIFALATLTVSLGMVAGGRLPFTFLPNNDSESIAVDIRLPVGTALPVTERLVRRIEEAALAQPELRSVSAMIGAAADLEIAGAGVASTHVAQVFLELTAVEERDRESAQVITAIRAALGNTDEAEEIRFQELSGGPGGTDITIEIRGESRARTVEAAARVRAMLAEMPGVGDISDDGNDGQPELQVTLRPEAAALGLSMADVAQQLRGMLFGIDAHVFSADREDIDVRVRLDEPTRRRVDSVENKWIITPRGDAVPLREIAFLADGTGPASIRRIDRQRTITVLADCDFGVNPEAVTASIAPRLNELQREFPDLVIRTAGRAEDLRDAFSSLPTAIAAAMLMIYVILAWLFSSYIQPFAVMLAIPFGIIGVVWGHLLMGFQLDFLSLIGFVALSGVVVNNSLVFVQFVNMLREQGHSLREALELAGRARVRAIVLTSATTFLGLTPLMFEQSFQARFLIPMAISVSFGLLSSTVLTLMVLPCILLIMDDARAATYWLWHGRPRPQELVDPRAPIQDPEPLLE